MTMRSKHEPHAKTPALTALAVTASLVLAGSAAAQVSGHAFGQPSDMAGPHVGTTGSPVRVSPGFDGEEEGPQRYRFDLGFTQATMKCCVGVVCDVLEGTIQVFGEAESDLDGEGSAWGEGTILAADVYALEPSSGTLVGGPAQAQGTVLGGRYTRAGMDLTLELDVPGWRWVDGQGEVMDCPAASVRIEGSMVPVDCDGGCSGDATPYGFGPSTLAISPG